MAKLILPYFVGKWAHLHMIVFILAFDKNKFAVSTNLFWHVELNDRHRRFDKSFAHDARVFSFFFPFFLIMKPK